MRKWTVSLLIAVCFVTIAPDFMAQSENETLRREVQELRLAIREINRKQSDLEKTNSDLVRDNADLRQRLDASAAPSDALESRINALTSELGSFAGTTVESVANPIKVSGEFRTRAGWTDDRDFGNFSGNNNFDADDDDGTFVDARFNLAFDFTFDKNISTHFELIANELFENRQANHNTGGLDEVDLYQGWILFTNIFGREELGARVGRQEIVLGNEFIFGNNDFFGGETHDSTLIWWNNDNFRLIFVWAKFDITNSFNASNHPYPVAGSGFDDDEAYVLYFTLKSIENHEIDLFYAYWNGHNGGTVGTLGNVLSAGTGPLYAHLFGLHMHGVFNVAEGLDYAINLAYETGDLSGAPAIDVDGLSFEIFLGLTFNNTNKARLFAGFLYAEGFDGDDTGFVPLYGERHAQINWDDHTSYAARWGIMDIVPMINVLAVQVGFTFRPREDWIVGITGLYAWHEEDVSTLSGSIEDEIGFEIDLFAEHKISDQATIGFGLGLFFPEDGAPLGIGDIAASLGGSFTDNENDVAVLFYLQTRVVF